MIGADAAAISRRESLHRMKLTEEELDDEGTGSEEQLHAAARDISAGAEPLYQDEHGRWVAEPTARESAVPLPPGFDDALAAQHARKELAELSIPNCRGPETHVYGNMAVHFYMKAAGE